MNQKRKVSLSIKDIARRAGVSTATVSRVVNHSPLVQKGTRDRVLNVIQKCGYTPNLSAQSLIKGKSNLLAMLIPPEASFFSAYYFRRILYGVTETLAKFHYRLMICQPEGFDPQRGYSENSNDFQADGLFVIAPSVNDRLVRQLERRRAPAVLISSRSRILDWVDLDNARVSIQVMEKLAGLGHRRIGFIGGTARGSNSSSRLRGYRSGLKKLNIPFDPDLVAKGNYTIESGCESARRLISLADRPTAIFAANDLMAMGAVQAINESGQSVPNDVSIFGFDDVDVAALSNPSLSTVRQPFYDMGRAAVETLISRLERPRTPRKGVVFPGEIIVRNSCAEYRNGEKNTENAET